MVGILDNGGCNALGMMSGERLVDCALVLIEVVSVWEVNLNVSSWAAAAVTVCSQAVV